MADGAVEASLRVVRPGVEAIVRAEGSFLWRTLSRLGVTDRDLEDMTQEVLVVVHRRLDSYAPDSSLRSWLYGICRRVAADYHRRAHRRRERLSEAPGEVRPAIPATSPPTPEDQAMATQAHRRLTQVLDALKPDHRVVFVMFEVEALSCAEIAATLEVPVGTVHSRLHAARKSFRRLARQRDVIERANEGGSGDA